MKDAISKHVSTKTFTGGSVPVSLEEITFVANEPAVALETSSLIGEMSSKQNCQVILDPTVERRECVKNL